MQANQPLKLPVQIVEIMKAKVADCLELLETTLSSQKSQFIMGSSFTAADIMLGHGMKNAKVTCICKKSCYS